MYRSDILFYDFRFVFSIANVMIISLLEGLGADPCFCLHGFQ